MLKRRTKSKSAKADNINWQQRFAQLGKQAQDERLRRYYQAGCVAPDTPIKEVPFASLDFETTGLDPDTHSIVSIGLVLCDAQRVYCRDSHHWLVRPVLPLHRESVTFHGITHSDLREAPDIREVLGDLLDVLAGRVVLVHHRAIERRFLEAALQWRLQEGIEFPVIDTMELEARLHRRKPPGFYAWLRGKKPESIRLADSRTRYGLPYYPPHHALTDAIGTAELLLAQLQHHFIQDTPVSELWH